MKTVLLIFGFGVLAVGVKLAIANEKTENCAWD